MKIEICQPDDFHFGVWRVRIQLDVSERERIGNNNLVFVMPELPERFFRVECPFITPSPKGETNPFWGKFDADVWEGIVQANGVEEIKCRTPLSTVKEALAQSINCALKRNGV